MSAQGSDDYSLTSECLVSVLANFPPVSLDAMASSTYTVCQRFFSKYESLNSCGIDPFSQSLDYSEFYSVFPPVSLALQVKGVFIIPLWPTSVWFKKKFTTGYILSNGFKKWFFSVPTSNPI